MFKNAGKVDVMTGSRRLDPVDSVLSEVGHTLGVLSGAAHAGRPNPAGKDDATTDALSGTDRTRSAALMRVNHVGEICAQALYRGQAVFCRDAQTEAVLRRAAAEEVDHLVWCRERLTELNSRPSYLNPIWYAGSFSLGVLASCSANAQNLGFMAETEKQVEQHLDRHLARLPTQDTRSRRILEQMRSDEIGHRDTAQVNGARVLPLPLRLLMRGMAKVMTTTAYRV